MAHIGEIFRDTRYSARTLARAPGFTLATILVLSLGIGANTAIFSVVYSVLLKPLPYRDPGRLVVALHQGQYPVAPANFLDFQAQVSAFEQMSAAQAWGGAIAAEDRAEDVPGLQVSANMIGMLGVEPAIGRAFLRGEDQPGARPVLLLSHRLWQRRFAGNPNVVGQTVRVSAKDYTVVGVMPPQFQFAPFWQTRAEMWTPLVLANRSADRAGRSLRIFARLRPDTAIAQAQIQMDVVAQRLAADYPKTNTNLGIQLVPLHEKVVGPVRTTLFLLLGTVVFVLIIACADVTNLSLTRAVARRKEIALRLAIGANRIQVMRQMAAESLLLAVAGGAGGLLVARFGIAALRAVLPAASLPRQQEVAIDGAVLGFALLASLLVGIVSGLIPAFQASRIDLNENLKSGGRSSTDAAGGRRTRSTLVVAQVSLALLLLVCAGLMIRSLRNLNVVDAGFNPRNLLTFQMGAPELQYDTPDKRTVLFQRVEDALLSLGSVQSVGAINHLPIGGDIWTFGYRVAGRPAPPPGRGFSAAYRVIRTGYLRTMQLPLLQGRDFASRDDRGSPLFVIVNEALARRQWPGESAVGRHLVINNPNDDPVHMTVIGVAKNARQSDWIAAPGDEMYLPYLQRPEAFGLTYLTYVVRTAAAPETLADAVEKAVLSIDRKIPLSRIESMQSVINDKLWRSRVTAMLLGGFAAIALLLAAVGIYGVISYGVRERTREIGVRMALGATRISVWRLVMSQSLRPVIAGIVLGTGAAVAASRLIAGLLYQVTATDPLTFAAVVLGLALTAFLATCVPAWRAMKADPLVALRHD